jgi:hypothetical protein
VWPAVACGGGRLPVSACLAASRLQIGLQKRFSDLLPFTSALARPAHALRHLIRSLVLVVRLIQLRPFPLVASTGCPVRAPRSDVVPPVREKAVRDRMLSPTYTAGPGRVWQRCSGQQKPGGGAVVTQL